MLVTVCKIKYGKNVGQYLVEVGYESVGGWEIEGEVFDTLQQATERAQQLEKEGAKVMFI